jgi:DinB superfamily
VTESTPTIQSALKAALVVTHRWVEGTLGDIDDELANRPGIGLSHSIAAIVAHAVLLEDAMLNHFCLTRVPVVAPSWVGPTCPYCSQDGMIHTTPLFASNWAGRTGVNPLLPRFGSSEADFVNWYGSVRIDMAVNRAYRQAVFAQSEEFIDSAADAAWARIVDSQIGPMPVANFYASVFIGHINLHIGEVSAIKGALGRKGYPF